MTLTEKIIEIVKVHPILYDLSHEDYKNLRKKDKVWQQVGVELKENYNEVKKKWKNLKDCYSKHLRNSKIGDSTKKNYKNWQWSNQMEWFRPYLGSTITESDVKEGVCESIPETLEDVRQNADIQVSTNSFTTPASNKPENQLTSDGITIRNKIKRNRIAEDNSKSQVDKMIEYFENKRSRTEHDGLDLLFMGYAKVVRTLSQRRQALVKLEIANVIGKYELQQVDEMASASSNLDRSNTSRPNSLTEVSLHIKQDEFSEDDSFHSDSNLPGSLRDNDVLI